MDTAQAGQSSATTTYTYDDANLKIFSTGPTGLTSITWTDELGRTIRQEHPDGSYRLISYNSANEQTVQDELGRSVNATILSADEWAERGSGFIRTVAKGALVPVVGDVP